jgi:hypothetical protein
LIAACYRLAYFPHPLLSSCHPVFMKKPYQPHPVTSILAAIFGLGSLLFIFVGFCLGLAWLMVRTH